MLVRFCIQIIGIQPYEADSIIILHFISKTFYRIIWFPYLWICS